MIFTAKVQSQRKWPLVLKVVSQYGDFFEGESFYKNGDIFLFARRITKLNQPMFIAKKKVGSTILLPSEVEILYDYNA